MVNKGGGAFSDVTVCLSRVLTSQEALSVDLLIRTNTYSYRDLLPQSYQDYLQQIGLDVLGSQHLCDNLSCRFILSTSSGGHNHSLPRKHHRLWFRLLSSLADITATCLWKVHLCAIRPLELIQHWLLCCLHWLLVAFLIQFNNMLYGDSGQSYMHDLVKQFTKACSFLFI